MPDYNTNGNPDNPGENARDDDETQQNPPPPEPAAVPQQQDPPQQQQNPGPDEGDESSEEDFEIATEDAEDEDIEGILAAIRAVRQDMELRRRLEANIVELAQHNFDRDLDFLAQYNFLLLGGMPLDLGAITDAVHERVQLGMATEDIQAIPGRAFEVPKCSICGEVFRDADHVRQLPSCRHEFHSSCLVDMLVRNNNADCPQCGKEIQFN